MRKSKYEQTEHCDIMLDVEYQNSERVDNLLFTDFYPPLEKLHGIQLPLYRRLIINQAIYTEVMSRARDPGVMAAYRKVLKPLSEFLAVFKDPACTQTEVHLYLEDCLSGRGVAAASIGL
jgi:hypothetical protein